jgi:acetyl esterase/lipase
VSASGLIGISFNHRSSGGRFAGMDAVAADVHDLVGYVRGHATELNIAPDSLCVWASSAGVPYLQEFLAAPPAFVRCLVAYYGMMDFQQFSETIPPETPDEERANTIGHFRKFSLLYHLLDHSAAVPPLFIARAGLDDPQANQTLDRFVAEASARGVTVEVACHPSGHHAFDILDNDETSREIIQQTIRFMQVHLLTQ